LLQNSYPSLLKKAGYRTGFFGKYGVGTVSNTKSDSANFREDDLAAQVKAGFDVVEDTGFAYFEPSDSEHKHHQNQILAEKAERFIDSTPSDRPFCLSISFHAPHDGPGEGYHAESNMLGIYAQENPLAGPLVDEAAFKSLPLFLQNSEGR